LCILHRPSFTFFLLGPYVPRAPCFQTPCILHLLCSPKFYRHILTPRCRVLLEQLIGLQLVKKFPAFHGTRRFITALTTVRHLSLHIQIVAVFWVFVPCVEIYWAFRSNILPTSSLRSSDTPEKASFITRPKLNKKPS
jgi:hypothetical protein